jgi:hypothetical protein
MGAMCCEAWQSLNRRLGRMSWPAHRQSHPKLPLLLTLSLVALTAAYCGLAAPYASAYDGPYSTCTTEDSPNNNHCYAVASWSMVDGESSGVNGLTMQILPITGKVPKGNTTYNFVSQEMWTGFHDVPCAWSETGVITGYDYDTETDRPFYASSDGCGTENSWTGVIFVPDLSIGYGNWFWVESLYWYHLPIYWEQWIEGAGPFSTGQPLPGGADQPIVGLEMTSTDIKASGQSQLPTWESPNGEWHAPWEDSYSHAERATPGILGENTAPTCALSTGVDSFGYVEWLSKPKKSLSCFEGDHDEYLLTSGITLAPLATSVEAERSTGQQPPVNAADWRVQQADSTLLSSVKVRADALRLATAQGDGTPTSIEAVKTNDRASIMTMDNNAVLPEPNATNDSTAWGGPLAAGLASEVYLVTMHGMFTDNFSVPPGDTAPTGTVLTIGLDAHTGALDSMVLSDGNVSSASLKDLGKVEDLG